MTIVDYAMKFIGCPYIWGGNGTGKCAGGFDCSGLVVECLQAFGIIPQIDLTAQGIYDILYNQLIWSAPGKGKEKAGDILFFGKDAEHITHVAICIGDGLMVEAGGGSSKCKTAATSTGMVRVRPISWRKDWVAALRE